MHFADSITIAALETDPFPIYARLRATDPIAPVPAANCWFATRWKDIEAITRNPDFTAISQDAPVNHAFGLPNVLTSEGDIHRELRGGIEPHYRPQRVAEYIETLVRPLADAQLTTFLAAGDNDLLTGYFEPISALSLARSFGFQDVDVATLQRWFHGLSQGAINFERDPPRALRFAPRPLPRSTPSFCPCWQDWRIRPITRPCRIFCMPTCHKGTRANPK